MKRNLYLAALLLILFTFTQVVFAGTTTKKVTSIIHGSISCVVQSPNIPTGNLTPNKTISLGRNELLILDAKIDIFGKSNTFILRGSYNGWEYGGDDYEEKISDKDVRVIEKDGKLIINTDEIINAGKVENNGATWEDIVTISVFDKNGNYQGNLFENVILNQLNAKSFEVVPNAKLTALTTDFSAKSTATGNYQIKAPKGRVALKISARGFVDKIIYVNTDGAKPILKDILLEKSNFKLGSRYRYYDFYSDALGNSRKVIVFLPASYMKDSKRRYPVLYMHDGQNIFVECVDGISTKWDVDKTVNRLVAERKMKEVIVVGIYNTNHRTEEYADYLRSQYADMIVKDIKPIIDARFRTLTGRENTALMGSSFGALVSLYTAYKYPDVFGMIGSLSTAPFKGDIFDTIQEKGNKHFAKIWVDTGTAEDTDGHYVRDALKLKSLFENQGYTVGKNLGYYEHEGANHNEMSWSERLWMPLTFFFGK